MLSIAKSDAGVAKNIDELAIEKQSLVDEAWNLTERLSGGEELPRESQKRLDELTGEGGQIEAKAGELAAAVELRQRRTELAAHRLAEQSAAGRAFGEGGSDDRSFIGLGAILGVRDTQLAPARAMPGSTFNRSSKTDPRLAHLAGCWATSIAGHGEGLGEARKELNRFGWGEYATQSEGVGSKGGYMVPAPIADQIIRNRDTVGVAPQTARVWALQSETLTLPEETARPTVYYPGEGKSITASDGKLETHTMTVKKRAVLVRTTSEVLADTPAAFGDWLIDSMSYATAEATDLEYLRGDGTATYGNERGLIHMVGSAGIQTADSGETSLADLDVEDWTKTIARLPGKYHANAAWIMSREVWNGSCLPLMANAGGHVFATMQAGASGNNLRWLGYPVFFSDLMPAAAAGGTVALFGDYSRSAALGDRGDMRIAASVDERFEQDLVSYRLTHRYDILVHNHGDDSTAGGYVALKLAAT